MSYALIGRFPCRSAPASGSRSATLQTQAIATQRRTEPAVRAEEPFFVRGQSSYADTYRISGANLLPKDTTPSSVPGPGPGFLRCLAAPTGSSPAECGRHARQAIDHLLADAGALLFQDLPVIDDEAAAHDFVEAMNFDIVKYEPFGAMRKKVGNLDAATNMPNAMLLPVHNEMSYNPRPNAKIMLLCLHAAEQGGENLLARTADVTAHMSAETLSKFRQKQGIRYVRKYSPEDLPPPEQGKPPAALMSWKQRTGSDSAEGAAQHWRDLGFDDISFDERGMMTVANVRPASVKGPLGEELFFNIASKAGMSGTDGPMTICYGNGEPIEPEVVSEVAAAEWKAACAVPLASGSLLVLDNYQVMHGRLPYEGDKRKMIAVLTSN